jgi:hypothetical protein
MVKAITQTHPPERRLRVVMVLISLHGLEDMDLSVLDETDEVSICGLASE